MFSKYFRRAGSPYMKNIAPKVYERYGSGPREYAKERNGWQKLDLDLRDKGNFLDYARLLNLSMTFDDNYQDRMMLQPRSRASSESARGQSQSGLGERTRFAFSFVTSHVQGILVDSFLHKEKCWEDACARFRGLSAIPHFDSPLGWIWESYCHSKIPSMKQLDVTDFETGKVVTLKDLPTKVIREARPEIYYDRKGYYMPMVRDPATFDAFSLTSRGVVMFQYSAFFDRDFYDPDRRTVFDADFATRKLDSINDALGEEKERMYGKYMMWYHVLVVPETEVKREDVAMAMQVHDSGDRNWTSRVKKCVLTLKMER
jgi:hypothetical protein